jgi:5-methylcytosine-specific restriction endonuclease McrA
LCLLTSALLFENKRYTLSDGEKNECGTIHSRLASESEGFDDGRIAMRSLKTLSDKELLNRLSKLVKQELNLTLEILPHLIEVENRKIYRSLGFSSMYVYCTDGLGYSESSANRRIYAARAIRKCPGAYDDLRKGLVHLGTLALAWRHLNPELLEEIRGKSYRQVQAIVSRFNPMMKHRDITRPVAVQKLVQQTVESQPARACPRIRDHTIAVRQRSGSGGLALSAGKADDPELGENTLRRGGKKSTTDTKFDSGEPTSSSDIPSLPEAIAKLEIVSMHHINCFVDDAVMQMLDRCKELLSGKYPCGIDYNLLIKKLASDWLEKHDPVQRSKRREKRKKSSNSNTSNKSETNNQEETSRYISPATRDAVYNRDAGRCTYVGSTGKRCESKWDLEIHHDETPFAMGGDHSIRNLRLLCAAHNKLEAERVYGRRHMEKHYQQRE